MVAMGGGGKRHGGERCLTGSESDLDDRGLPLARLLRGYLRGDWDEPSCTMLGKRGRGGQIIQKVRTTKRKRPD